jgi:hypothetical protein
MKKIERLIKRIITLIKDIVIVSVLKMRRFKASDSIIIISEARGGSTWLLEMMKDILPVCINWEPLSLSYGVIPSEWRPDIPANDTFGWRPYIPEHDSNPDNYILFKKIHEYKVHSRWTRSYLSIKQTLKSKYVLTKYVRANLLIPYLTKNFRFKHKPIFLIRHPIDICISSINAFGKNKNNLVKSNINLWNNNKYFLEHSSFINKLESILELKIANWCINNCPTLSKLDTSELCVVFYSDLLLNPKKEIRRILRNTNLLKYKKKLEKIEFRKASTTDYKNLYYKSPQKQLNKNFDKLDMETKDKIQAIFDYFNFKLFTAYSPIPNKQFLK